MTSRTRPDAADVSRAPYPYTTTRNNKKKHRGGEREEKVERGKKTTSIPRFDGSNVESPIGRLYGT